MKSPDVDARMEAIARRVALEVYADRVRNVAPSVTSSTVQEVVPDVSSLPLSDRRSIALAAMRSAPAVGEILPPLHVAASVPPSPPMCDYKERDQDTGEWYACGLSAHPSKVRHTRGQLLPSQD